ncbi:dephospho-CoA kinase [Pseudoalteromonas sp. BSi20439]|jgi:dephospho-CoA kinase|uniref:dephospho-CoA kinase n=1 Tax=Pseudoalteromonas sp. BSi20439 TaxID=420915 RepID=UPI0002319E2B|nr:dephospho-CoA kinase [Pseudoalteromonas sp. BSi20439]GAA71889.1 dephospho-CoA kinase [Pseudoalteromonas sp. BSi20439]
MNNTQHHKNNWVLGLTGGIGCGKTAVSNMLAELGITIVDADIIARQVVEPGTEGLNAIVKHFGTDILNEHGALNRSELRARIFSNAEQKAWLNALLHPLIRTKLITDLTNAQSDYVVLVAPLLFENELDGYCHRTLLIDVPKEVQIARTTQRDNISIEQAEQIIDAQMSREQKQHKADDILNNNRNLNDVKQDLLELHKYYLQQAKSTI